MKQNSETMNEILEKATTETANNFKLKNEQYTLIANGRELTLEVNNVSIHKTATVMVCTTDDPGIFEKVIKKFNINLKEKDPNYFSDDAFAAAIFAGNYNVANYIVKYLFENKEVDQNYYNYMKNMIQKKRDYCNTRYLKDTEEQMKDLQELEQYIENETKTKKLAPTKPLLNYENEGNEIIRNKFKNNNLDYEPNELFRNRFENEMRNIMKNRLEDVSMEEEYEAENRLDNNLGKLHAPRQDNNRNRIRNEQEEAIREQDILTTLGPTIDDIVCSETKQQKTRW